ncbi:hypothetical protein RHGRI_002338 [Rhododendron griersonianum]|uniref:Helicase ATP-binding domain-containing protein n=1 Tax=Rhododendron griersonianum TaxID=479676 RepID=A0AAV6LR82_9ERIC|nr:hypothetical protein RHGRI_002338 [Rhododendron griersonianum]
MKASPSEWRRTIRQLLGNVRYPKTIEVVVPKQQESASKRRTSSSSARTCVHEVAVPSGYTPTLDETIHGTLSNPVYNGKMAKTYPFNLDPFQQVSVACLERNESVLVSAPTSAGKTAVAEYAIAMGFREKQRVIYTSPLKSLSNQKYRELSQEFSDVGLMTGDVTLSPNASCLIMTTEILRGMLYRGSEVLKEVAWVIFDEIHYMRDRERGVVWEESIIFLPPAIKMPCHVVYTDFRPTPLQHYAFPMGGSGLYLVVDENDQFREDNFMKVQDSLAKQGDGNKGANSKPSGRIARGGTASGGSDIYKIVKMIMERKFEPVIIFSFSRRECEHHAMSMSKLDFNTQEEKDVVEQFAMGLNMPAKTVVFTSFQKWDGDSHRYIGSGEYIQMSGRAGRRGKDERGICIIMIDAKRRIGELGWNPTVQHAGETQMEMDSLKEMVLGRPAPLVSTFRLSYYTILNLMSRAEGQFTAEHVIRNSFHQFQYEKALPDMGNKISKLEDEAASLDASGEAVVAEYHKLKLDIVELEKKMMAEITRPERVLYFLLPGRLVKVREGGTDWGWGVVVNVVKKSPAVLRS